MSVDQFEPMQNSSQQKVDEMVKASYAVELQTENAEVLNSNSGILSMIFSTLQTIGEFIIKNPGQAITMALAMQIAAAAAFNPSQQEDEEEESHLTEKDRSETFMTSQLEKLASESVIEIAYNHIRSEQNSKNVAKTKPDKKNELTQISYKER